MKMKFRLDIIEQITNHLYVCVVLASAIVAYGDANRKAKLMQPT
jgi:hypothetical protein